MNHYSIKHQQIPKRKKGKESHQCGSVSEGIPRDSDVMIPRHVPI